MSARMHTVMALHALRKMYILNQMSRESMWSSLVAGGPVRNALAVSIHTRRRELTHIHLSGLPESLHKVTVKKIRSIFSSILLSILIGLAVIMR